jgi:hypothetical protein
MIAVGPRMGYLLYVGVKKSGQVWVIILLDTEFRYGGGQAARNSVGGDLYRSVSSSPGGVRSGVGDGPGSFTFRAA